ncbi:hypothetical protein LMG26411_04287 [Cupriavidus numazuensis]|uniref:ATPase AAA-type core domain-containing protein n=2 Tax=Cupriavidus numazuensis TaxID=221992 RepID=A0ABM8TL35_9BURK|nr:hypothetical protein LMG26411_04287 [Cupriavidus numazuensis]
MVDELAMFIKRRQHSSRSRTSELDFSLAHINLQNIKLENISSLLVERYQFARVMATKKIQSALFDTLAIAISEDGPKESEQQTLNPDFLSTLKANSERIAEALNDSTENTFKTKLIEILESLDDEKTKNLLTNRLLVTLLKKMIKELEVEKLMLSSINLLTDTFNEYLIDSKKLVFKENRVVIEIEGDEHDLEDLSSGERHILTFLSLVLFGARERDFLIIDEPEISLNILWQRKLMALFTKLAPSTQIIVASHSPAIAKDNRKYLSELRVGKI